MILIDLVVVLLLAAAIVAIITRRAALPYTFGLVIAGLLLALIPQVQEVRLSQELIFLVFLPPLIFEAALHNNWKTLVRDLPVIGVLAVLGVVFSAAVMALGMHFLLGWGWQAPSCSGHCSPPPTPSPSSPPLRQSRWTRDCVYWSKRKACSMMVLRRPGLLSPWRSRQAAAPMAPI